MMGVRRAPRRAERVACPLAQPARAAPPPSRAQTSLQLRRTGAAETSQPRQDQSGGEAHEMAVQRVAPDAAWFAGAFAHLRRGATLFHNPFRALARWQVHERVVDVFCNQVPNLVADAEVRLTRSFAWFPARVLSSGAVARALHDHLAYVHRAPPSSLHVPPPRNLIFVLRCAPPTKKADGQAKGQAGGQAGGQAKGQAKGQAGDQAGGQTKGQAGGQGAARAARSARVPSKPFWVPASSEWAEVCARHAQLGVESLGVPRVLLEVLGEMHPEFRAGYLDLLPREHGEPERIDEARLARRITLESATQDEFAIPQAEAVAAVEAGLARFSSVLLNGYCGSGKTVMMIEAVCRIGLKTAVLVNKGELAQQWVDRFRAFAPSLRTTIVQGDACDVPSSDVCIFLMQSLYARAEPQPLDTRAWREAAAEAARPLAKRGGGLRRLRSGETYPWSWLSGFGLVCVDEAHRAVAATALPCLAMFPSARFICATATPDRQDATHDSLGPVFGVAAAVLQQPLVSVGVFSFECDAPDPLVPIFRWKRKKYGGQAEVDVTAAKVDFEDVNYSVMVRNLGRNGARNAQLLACMWDAAVVKGRQMLVLGLLKGHLVELAAAFYALCQARCVLFGDAAPCGLLFPETREEERERVKRARVVFATFQYASEAFDVGTLSALLLVSPYKSRLVQVIGRILRRKRGGATLAEGASPSRRALEEFAEGFPQGDKWHQLPLVYLCKDRVNPWFDRIFAKQMSVLRATYDAHVTPVRVVSSIAWPGAALDECVARFRAFASSQVSEFDRLFGDSEDREDLFGDDEEEAPLVMGGDDDDQDDWFE